MDTMQQELGDSAALLGVNIIGQDSYNESFTSTADIPWLQDTADQGAWDLWSAQWRDVWILDGTGHLYTLYNLNDNDLGYEPDYTEMRELILEAAAR